MFGQVEFAGFESRPHLVGVRTQPCEGSGVPSRGMPLNPDGQVQTGSEIRVVHIALGPQESGMAQGSYPFEPPSVVDTSMTGANGVAGAVSTSSKSSKFGLTVLDRNLGEI